MVRLSVVVCVRLPDVPVIVIVVVPGTAAAPAVTVSVLDVVVTLGINPAVTPLGKPDNARLTLPLNPVPGFTVIVLVPFPPCITLNVFGAAVSVNAGVTVRLSVVVRVRLPDVPVIVIVVVPGAAAALAVNVSVLADVVGFGLKAAVTPLGRPDAARLTLPLKPFAGFTVTVLVPLLPCTTLNVLGVADNV